MHPERPVIIWGSCVSRDTFEFLPRGRFRLSKYIARQSLLSANHPASRALLDQVSVTSRFKRRMIVGDIVGNAWTAIADAVGDEVVQPLILMDLTDERLGVLIDKDGGRVTVSNETIETGIADRLQSTATYVRFGTDQHYYAWRAAFDEFCGFVRRALGSTVVLLDIPWAERDGHGRPAPHSYGLSANDANRSYRRYVDHARTNEHVEVVALDKALADSDHRWGPAPFHYATEIYRSAAASIEEIALVRPPVAKGALPRPVRALASDHLFGVDSKPRPDDKARAEEILAGKVLLPRYPLKPLPPPSAWNECAADGRWITLLHSLRWLDVLRRTAVEGSRAMHLHRALLLDWAHANPSYERVDAGTRRTVWNGSTAGARSVILAGAVSIYGLEAWMEETLRQHRNALIEAATRHDRHQIRAVIGLSVTSHLLGEPGLLDVARSALLTVARHTGQDPNASGEPQTPQISAVLIEAVRHLHIAGGLSASEASALIDERSPDAS